MSPRWSALCAGLLLASASLELRAQPAAPPSVERAGLDATIGARLPLDARFHSSDGREVSLSGALGARKPALLVLAYNRCEMLCSLVLASLADLVRDLDASPEPVFSVVTLSIDPTDTIHEAARMRSVFLERAGRAEVPAPSWTFLVGKQPGIEAVASALGFRYVWDPASEQYAHPAVIFAISAEGELIDYFEGLSPDRERVRSALRGSRTTSGITETILSCFRFDATSTKYGPTIAALLRGGATVLALSVIGLLAWLLRRERRRSEREAS